MEKLSVIVATFYRDAPWVPATEMPIPAEHKEHVLMMLQSIYNVIIQDGTAGEFITSLCSKDYSRAAVKADNINCKYISLYIIFVDYCHELKKEN